MLHPDLKLPAPRSVRNKLLLCISQPICGNLLQQPARTEPPWLRTVGCMACSPAWHLWVEGVGLAFQTPAPLLLSSSELRARRRERGNRCLSSPR